MNKGCYSSLRFVLDNRVPTGFVSSHCLSWQSNAGLGSSGRDGD